MAKLGALVRNSERILAGSWVTVAVNDDDTFEIRTRGFTPRYKDVLRRHQTEAARQLNTGREAMPGDRIITADNLPPSEDDRCQGMAVASECFMDVRELFHADGTPVTADEFRALLADPVAGADAIRLAIQAAAKVTADREAEIKDAVGNLPAA